MWPHPGVVALGVAVLVAGPVRGLGQVGRLHGAGTGREQPSEY
jgi:hypothetical protein